MATFPSGKLTFNGYKHQRISNVLRSDMESGPAKQALVASRDYLRFPVTYLFTKTEFVAFQDWVVNDINVVGVFDWTEPLSSEVLNTRIVGGDVSEAAPLNPHMENWVVKMMLEVVDDGAIDLSGYAPIWVSPIQFTWVVGQFVRQPLVAFIENPTANDIYLLDSDPDTLPLALEVIDGVIIGTVADLQGGTLYPIFSAENSLGKTYSTFSVAIVDLPLQAPVMSDPADIDAGTLEAGSSHQFQLEVVNSEGSPLFYEIQPNQVLFDTITVNPLTGLVNFLIAAAQQGTYFVAYRVTDTETDLSDVASHTVVIDPVSGTSEIPVFANLSSDALLCSIDAVPPTWKAGGDTFVAAISDSTEKSIDMIGGYIEFNGGDPINLMELSTTSEALPPDWTFDTNDTGVGIGFLTRIAITNTVDESRTLSFRASNDGGSNWSDISPDFDLTFWDDTASEPTITGIRGTEGTTDVYVTFSEAVFVDPDDWEVGGEADSYELGFAWEVNPVTPAVPKTHTYVDGGGTSTLHFTLDLGSGVVLTGDNTIRLTYTT